MRNNVDLMSNMPNRCGRRSVLKSIGISLATLGIADSASAGPSSRSAHKTVPKGQAKKAARSALAQLGDDDEFSSWTSGSLGRPTTAYMKNAGKGPAFVPSAYIFPVGNGGSDGYITTAARNDWKPILEFSTATAPTSLIGQAADQASALGHEAKDRLIYHGGVKYGLEASDNKAVNVRNGKPESLGIGVNPRKMQFNAETAAQQWESVELSASPRGPTTGSVGTNDVIPPGGGDSVSINAVPAWTEHDGGGAGSTNIGSGDDSWNSWDGCTPIAGSMIIAFHEGISESQGWAREAIIDRLHNTMNTTDGGSTDPWNIDNGFDNYSAGSHSYNGRNIYAWTHPDFTYSEIDVHNRPFLLNMTSGDKAEDRNQNYGDHTATVVGFTGDADYLELHDTWDDQSHYLQWGSWAACSYTKVTT